MLPKKIDAIEMSIEIQTSSNIPKDKVIYGNSMLC